MTHGRKISVVGLGYVGLPVVVAFGMKEEAIGFDINKKRVEELKSGIDHTLEITSEALKKSDVFYTCEIEDLKRADFHIVAVPTPVDNARQPDLTPLLRASETVGKILKRGDIVVYESTVYPGATEEDCVPILERLSGLKLNKDFFVGYSPERINPGDKEHTFTNIPKVVSGSTPEALDAIAKVYESVVKPGVYRASSIKVAESAKVIENTQRDLNIALMNELAIIFKRMGIDTQDVIDAASTKWNFLKFKPGLVGGHCIGVDPYYLTYKAKQTGYRPEVILAGRRINDTMGKYIAEQTVKEMIKHAYCVKGAKVGILGFTFKEDVPDIRNSRVIDIVHELQSYLVNVVIHDPVADAREAHHEYGIELSSFDEVMDVDALILAVAHKEYLALTPADYKKRFRGQSLIIDVKSALDKKRFTEDGVELWRL